MEDCVAEDVEVTSIVGSGCHGRNIRRSRARGRRGTKALPRQKMRQGRVLEARRRRCRGRDLGEKVLSWKSRWQEFLEKKWVMIWT
jgi:hypothetical protein